MKLYFAPLEGITGYIYRNAFRSVYTGIDKYFIPFLSPNKNRALSPKEIKDVLPAHNQGMYAVPQILTNRAEQFLQAARELEEETGYTAGKMELLISLYTTVAFCNEKIDVYVATDLKKSKQHLDDDEFLDVESHDIEEMIQMIYDCKIQDGKTISALLAYYNKYIKQ